METLINHILNWLDILWIPAAYFIVRKIQRIYAIGFVIICILVLRLQNELMTDIGYAQGFLPFLSVPALYRGFVVYGVFIGLFLLLSRWSRERDRFIYVAASITVLFVAFCVSTFVMFL